MGEGSKADVGNPAQPPFGNGDGATSAGPSEGGHDFIEDGKGSGPKTGGGFDVTKQNRPQKSGEPDFCKDSVPDGGRLPFPKIDSHSYEGNEGGFETPASEASVDHHGGGPEAGAVAKKPFKI